LNSGAEGEQTAITSASNVIPFRDPDVPLENAEREAAIKAYREVAAAIAEQAVAQAFCVLGRLPACRRLGCEDVYPLFGEAFRREVDKSGSFPNAG
jgi:hypothetical protein